MIGASACSVQVAGQRHRSWHMVVVSYICIALHGCKCKCRDQCSIPNTGRTPQPRVVLTLQPAAPRARSPQQSSVTATASSNNMSIVCKPPPMQVHMPAVHTHTCIRCTTTRWVHIPFPPKNAPEPLVREVGAHLTRIIVCAQHSCAVPKSEKKTKRKKGGLATPSRMGKTKKKDMFTRNSMCGHAQHGVDSLVPRMHVHA